MVHPLCFAVLIVAAGAWWLSPRQVFLLLPPLASWLLLHWKERARRALPATGLGALRGRCVLITGAARGIGAALALHLAERGRATASSEPCLALVLVDKDAAELVATAKAVAALGGERLTVVHYADDISDAQRVDDLFARAEREMSLGAPTVAVASQGVVVGRPLIGEQPLEPEAIRRTMEVNFLGSVWVARALLRSCGGRKEASGLVLLSSLMGFMGGARVSDYCASKFALLGFAESLRLELRAQAMPGGLGVMAVCPYHVSSGMFEGAFSKDSQEWWRPIFSFLRRLIFPELSPAQVAASVAAELAFPADGSLRLLPKILVLPPLAAVVPPLLRLLPAPLQEFVLDAAGGCHGMDGFRGRQGQQRSAQSPPAEAAGPEAQAGCSPQPPEGKAEPRKTTKARKTKPSR